MKIITKVSRDLVDHRRRYTVGAVLGAAIAAIFGVTIASRPPEPDPDRDLIYVVSTALDRGQDDLASRMTGYRRAKVVLYEQSTSTGCGRGLASSGPFYCPSDERIYVDLAFLRAITGDLARAYVITHELGHHAQKLRGLLATGTSDLEIELGADCLAGALMRTEQRAGYLEAGDIAQALATAAAVGDDRLNPGSSPETWTHGTSAQRAGAVLLGLSGATCHL